MFSIDYRSRTPIYRQIIDNVENLAARGVLQPDGQLPSVRSLAVELSINPNTIAKAYSELEAKGIIYSLPGRGSFLCGNSCALRRRSPIRSCSEWGLPSQHVSMLLVRSYRTVASLPVEP